MYFSKMSLKSCCTILPGLIRTIGPKPLNQFSFSLRHFPKHTSLAFYATDKNAAPSASTPKEIYYGNLTPQVKAVKFFSFSSSMIGLVGQPFLYKAVVGTGNVPIIVAAYTFIGFFTLATPILLHFITKKYVTHLLYKEDTDSYIARTVNFYCVAKETEFKTEDVQVPDVPGMFTTLFAKGQPLFFDPRLFEYPQHYARIMGYDKPIDFKLSEETDETKKQQ